MSNEEDVLQAVENEVRNDFHVYDAFTHRKDHTAAAVLALAKQVALLRRELAERSVAAPPQKATKAKGAN